jgi:hypothetical protein
MSEEIILAAGDDGSIWGFIEEGAFVSLPKRPMVLANMGPPPFDVTLPSGEVRHIILEPCHDQP